MSLTNILSGIVTVEGTIAAISPDTSILVNSQIPTMINATPCFINFPERAEIERQPNARRPLHSILINFYLLQQKVIVPSVYNRLIPYLESTLDAFDTHLTLGGYAQNSQVKEYSIGPLMFNGQLYVGISFIIEALEIVPYSFAA